MVTIKDLAQKSGYTVATISRALNNNPLVAEKTRKRILEIAGEIGYTPNALARGLVTQTTSSVGIMVPDITNPYFPTIVKAAQDTLKQRGYFTIVCNSDWMEDTEIELARMLYEHRVRGIIMDPLSDQTYKNIYETGIRVPIVFVGNRPSEDDTSSVLINNYNASVVATQHLIDLGHKKIGFVGGIENTYVNRNRFGGYQECMRACVGAVDPTLVMKCKFKQEGGYSAAKAFVDQGNVPTAVIAGNDIIAFGVIQGFRNSGYDVPRDVSVIGFDDIEFAENVGLTTMREPRYDMGVTAATLLLEAIDRVEAGKSPLRKSVVYEPELIDRSTCAPPRQRAH